MADYYQVRLYNPNKRYLRLIDNYASLNIGRKQNAIGSVTVTMTDASLPIEYDSILLIERSVNNGAPAMLGETIFLVEKKRYTTEGIAYTAYDANFLLNWRIVTGNSGTHYANKELPADDYIKSLAREAFSGLAVDVRRLWPITIESDLSLCPIATQESAKDKLINIYQTLTQISANKGTPLFFDIISDYDLNLTLRTYANYRGIDRQSLTIGHEHLIEPVLEMSNEGSPTVIYSGGNGRGENRQVEMVYSEDALKSPFAWREAWVADKDLSSKQALIDEGYSQLRAKRPTVTFSADLVSSPEMAFGKHFNFGDVVTAEAYGYNVPCSIDEFNIDIVDGKAELKIKLEGTNV